MKASQLINGTYGTVSYDGDKVAECLSFKAKTEYDKEEIDIPGEMMTDYFPVGASGTGSMEIYKISSQFINAYDDAVMAGQDPRCTLVSKVVSKNSGKEERIQFTGVSFDDTTFADWAQKTVGKVTLPFTYTGKNILDSID